MLEKRGRSYRRHHYNRLKLKRQRLKYWGRGYEYGGDWCPTSLGISVNTPSPCSCIHCGNQRRFYGATLSERSFSELNKLSEY